MRRRPVPATTLARPAVWTRRLALGGAALALLAVVSAHHPRVPAEVALVVLAAGLGCAVLAVLTGFRALATIWVTGETGLGRVLVGLLLAAGTLAYPGTLAASVAGQPVVVAATTDVADPPHLSRASRAVAARGRGVPSTARPVAAGAPFMLDGDATDSHAAVLKVLAGLHWRVLDAVAPGGRLGLGHIDAVVYSPVMHLPQDIAIRLAPQGGQTRIDVLSAARLGVTDFGESLGTIRQLGTALDALDED